MNVPAPTSLTFEQALAELDRVVRELEDGKTGLEDSLARYEHGVALLKQCYGQLRKAQQRIEELVSVDEQGNPTTKPFEHTAAAVQENKKRES